MSTALTIAAALVAWFLLGCIVALLIGRALPASPEPDEHEACHGDPEALRAVRQSGVIGDFHAGSNLTTRERNHV